MESEDVEKKKGTATVTEGIDPEQYFALQEQVEEMNEALEKTVKKVNEL